MFAKLSGPQLSSLVLKRAAGVASYASAPVTSARRPADGLVASLAATPLAPDVAEFLHAFDFDYQRYKSLVEGRKGAVLAAKAF